MTDQNIEQDIEELSDDIEFLGYMKGEIKAAFKEVSENRKNYQVIVSANAYRSSGSTPNGYTAMGALGSAFVQIRDSKDDLTVQLKRMKARCQP